MIFPPAFFISMMHVMVHLSEEALLAGPVNYRWMYPIERLASHFTLFPLNTYKNLWRIASLRDEVSEYLSRKVYRTQACATNVNPRRAISADLSPPLSPYKP
ncbi:unnamed protein product [Prunus armeniaca]